MAGGNAIRGSRVGAGPMGEAERGEAAPRMHVSYFCAGGHVTSPAFAADAQVPESWDCPRCGLPPCDAHRKQQIPGMIFFCHADQCVYIAVDIMTIRCIRPA